MSGELKEIHRVPGKWRCLQCGQWTETAQDVTARPLCPCGYGVPCVPLTWKAWGPLQEGVITELQGRLHRSWERLEMERDARAEYAVALSSGQEAERRWRAQAERWRWRAGFFLAAGLASGAGLGYAWGLFQ